MIIHWLEKMLLRLEEGLIRKLLQSLLKYRRERYKIVQGILKKQLK